MTDRVKGLTVSLTDDIREDDIKMIMGAILCIRGVREVAASVVETSDWINRSRIRAELGEKLMDVLYPELKEAREKAGRR